MPLNEVVVLDSDTETHEGRVDPKAGMDRGGYVPLGASFNDCFGISTRTGGISSTTGFKGDGTAAGEHPIDEGGDLQLVVTAGPRIRLVFRVDSRALTRSSGFWRKLLHRQSASAEPVSPASMVLAAPTAPMAPMAAATPRMLTADIAPVADMTSPSLGCSSPKPLQYPFAFTPVPQWMADELNSEPQGQAMLATRAATNTVHLELPDLRAHVSYLGTLLHAAHGQLDRVPTLPTLREFCSLVVLANRCDMMSIMRGHIHTWLSTNVMAEDAGADGLDGCGPLQMPGLGPGFFTRLHIFWEVGCQAEFQQALATLAWHTQMDRNGALVSNQRNSRLPRPIMREEVVAVSGVADLVASHRLRIITLVLDLLNRRIQLLQGPMPGTTLAPDPNTSTTIAADGEVCSCAAGNRTSRDCDAYHFGLLVQELRRMLIDPYGLPTAMTVCKSPHALCCLIESVHDAIDARSEPPRGRFLHGHGHCNPLSPMIVQLKNLRDSDAVELSDFQQRHFQEQIQKMGKKHRGA